MSDQTLDPQLVSLLRTVLKAEAARLAVTVVPEQILERRASRPGEFAWPRIDSRRSLLALSGAAAVVVAAVLGLGVVLNQQGNIAASPTPSSSPSPSPDLGIFSPIAGWIVYVNPYLSSRDVIWGIDPRSTDAGSHIALTFEPGDPLGWSGDGTRLLIQAEDHLFVLDADGTQTVVTHQQVGLRHAAISPDGKQIAFVGQASTGKSALFLVDASGGQAELLWESQMGSIRAPAFSPDGAAIAYVDGSGDHSHSVWVINVDGTDPRQIVTSDLLNVGHVNGMAWAPADRIALGFAGSIYTFSPDGSDFTKVVGASGDCSTALECSTLLPTQAAWPRWSPDGSQIAYKTGCLNGPTSVEEAGCQLAIADADGSNVRLLRNGRPGPWHPGINRPGIGVGPSPTPVATALPSEFRRDGEFIVFQPLGPGRGWDLAAQDPETGEIRTIVETAQLVDCLDRERCTNLIRKAEWSSDGMWIAFEISNASLDGPPLGPCDPAIGIWVQGPNGGPSQLTTPCDAPPPGSDEPVQELWAWSPVEARLAYVRIDGETNELLVIEPSDGTRLSLGSHNIDPPYPVDSSSLAWSPDGSRIAYAAESSVYAVDVSSGERSLLADSFETIIDIAWSPDGSQLLVHDQGRYRIQVMNGDGSDLHVVLEGQDACCETAWSPNGDRIVYMLSVGPVLSGWHSEVWTVTPEGLNPIEISDLGSCGVTARDALPVWTPDGTQVAYGGCGGWVVANADGTGDVQPIDELLWRSWYSSGLTGGDLARIGQIDH